MQDVLDAEVIAFPDADRFERWLAEHHARASGVWVKVAKKGSGRTSVTVTDALDVALCYGWIDSQRRTHDQDHYLQRYSPRRPHSSWSQVNVDKVETLLAAGRMRAAGQAAIDAAKADGRWAAAYPSQREATVPDDLAEALTRDRTARDRFEQLDRTQQYALFLRLLKARTPARRAVQLEQIVGSLSDPPAAPEG